VNSFDEFVEASSRSLLQAAWLLTGDWAAAEDLVQLTLLQAWRRWNSIEPAARYSYARRVLLNRYLTGRRRRWSGEQPSPDIGVEGPRSTRAETMPADSMHSIDLRTSLRSALATLPAKQRAVVVLRYFCDLSEADTAQLLDCSSGTVKSQGSRALAKLRSHPGLRTLLEEVTHG
jgi:RNA polymerase sigma-70 factor (sigma-E family)